MNKKTAEEYFEKITIVEYVVFDKKEEKHFFDSTPDQCCEYIWKNLWETAVIKKITEFSIKGVKPIFHFQRINTVVDYSKQARRKYGKNIPRNKT